MEKTFGYYDLCIPFNNDGKILRAIIKQLIELGYKTIAIEQTFDYSPKSGQKRGTELFPEPHDITSLQNEFGAQIKIFQRLTILYSDQSVTHVMGQSTNLKKFHLIAGQPKTNAALTHACTTFRGDLITFDDKAGIKLQVSRKDFKIAVDREMYFEIKYALAIRDSSHRKDMIKIAHNYFTRGKLTNIIFSSGAEHEFELRGPYDVASLAYIFGLSENQGKNGVDRSCRQLFLKAESRRYGKTVMICKATGPVILSESSDSSDMENASDNQDNNNENSVENDDSETDTDLHKIKRLKTA